MKKNISAALILLIATAIYAKPYVCAADVIRVAFIDSGISEKHISAESILVGKNYVFPDKDTDDRIGHGTAVAGEVLGSAEMGIAGSCPSAVAVPLVSYDVYPSGVAKNGGIDALCDAIYDAVDMFGCRVINISMGVPSESEKLYAAVMYAEEHNAVIVSAVGNDNLSYPQRVYYPAAYKTVIGVGAADVTGAADFSQRNAVSVLAYGRNIPVVPNRNSKEQRLVSGTSYACARVSGLCAQLLADNPSLTPPQVRALIFASAKDTGQCGFDIDSGFGIAGTAESCDEQITRAVFAQLLYIAENEPSFNSRHCFKDVTANAPEDGAIAWASENKIICGISETEFAPYAPVTREQMAVIAYRYAEFKKYDVTVQDGAHYTDKSKISDYAMNAVGWAADNGIMLGNTDGSFAPLDNSVKAQAAAVLRRLFEI